MSETSFADVLAAVHAIREVKIAQTEIAKEVASLARAVRSIREQTAQPDQTDYINALQVDNANLSQQIVALDRRLSLLETRDLNDLIPRSDPDQASGSTVRAEKKTDRADKRTTS